MKHVLLGYFLPRFTKSYQNSLHYFAKLYDWKDPPEVWFRRIFSVSLECEVQTYFSSSSDSEVMVLLSQDQWLSLSKSPFNENQSKA